MNKYKKIPYLRFKDFTNDWVERKLNDVLYENKLIKNDTGKRLTVKLNLKGVYERENKPFEKIGITRQYVRNTGDFIYGKQNINRGCFGIVPSHLNGYVSSIDIPSFKFNQGFSNYFLFYKFSNFNFYDSLKYKMEGSSSKRFHVKTFLNTTLWFPNFIEQQKIANFFLKFDNLISLYKKKLELMNHYKSYYFYALFPNGGDLARKRFYGFTHKWKLVKLIEISKVKTGRKVSYHQDKNGLYPFFVFSNKPERINSYSHDGEAVLIVGNGCNIANIHYINGKFDHRNQVYKICDSTENIKFIFYYLQSNAMQKKLLSLSQGSAINSLKPWTIKNIELLIPTNKQEQQKIVDFFSRLDENINLLEQKIINLKKTKNYYLQKMFI